jgi:hypothetical protein
MKIQHTLSVKVGDKVVNTYNRKEHTVAGIILTSSDPFDKLPLFKMTNGEVITYLLLRKL